jgi:hypothetical protein
LHVYLSFFLSSSSHLTGLENRSYFLTTSIRAFGSSGSDGKRKRKEWNRKTGTDFGYWNMQIEDYLYGRKLHLPLLGEQPNSMEDDE